MITPPRSPNRACAHCGEWKRPPVKNESSQPTRARSRALVVDFPFYIGVSRSTFARDALSTVACAKRSWAAA
jgi:hypothetical protein